MAYTYDLANHMTQVVDPTGTYGFTFDADGRLTQTSTAYSFIAGKTFTVGYGYDAAANRTSMTDPQNASSSYVYDTLNRLQTLTSPQGAFGFGYDALSRRTQLTRPNSVTTTYSYDPLSRLLSVLHKLGTTTLDGATYSVDSAGNRTAKTDRRTGTATTYGYDSIYQLLTATQGGSTTENYSYDPVGNRLTSLAGNYSNNNSNELTSSPTATFTYDNNGNSLSKTDSTGSTGSTGYAWDFENRLTSITLPASGGTVSYKYDPFGRRIQKSSSSGTTNYVYDGSNSLEELDSSGNLIARYTQTQNIDEPLAMLRSGSTSFYNADGLGSITSSTNSSGALAVTYTFDSFGNLINSTGSLTNPFRYTAREFDSESGVYFYRARYYDPVIGRFLREDPRKFKGGIDFYAYVSNQPLNLVDPYGLWPTLGDLGKALKQGKGAWDKAKGYAGQIGCQVSYWYCISTTFDNLDSLSQAKQGMPRPTEDELEHPSDNQGASQGAKQLHDCIAGNPNCKKVLEECLLGVWAGGILPH
jgi:RHS repeat-associated protein